MHNTEKLDVCGNVQRVRGGGGLPIFSCQKLNVQTNGGKLNESVAYIFICA